MKYLLSLLIFSATLSAENVVLIHGFMRSKKCMGFMASHLRKEGFEPVRFDYPSRNFTIQEHAEELVKELQQLACHHPGEPIHFVTHSLGGIVLRAALSRTDCPEEAKCGRAVLLAPPNRGSRLAHYAFLSPVLGAKAGRELHTCNHFDHLGEFPETLSVLVIAGTAGFNPLISGKNDGKVTVEETRLKTPHKHVVLPVGHSYMMFSPTVMRTTSHFLS